MQTPSFDPVQSIFLRGITTIATGAFEMGPIVSAVSSGGATSAYPSSVPAGACAVHCRGRVHVQALLQWSLRLAEEPLPRVQDPLVERGVGVPSPILASGAAQGTFGMQQGTSGQGPSLSMTARRMSGHAMVASAYTSEKRPPSSGGTNLPHETPSE